ncbi:hypothetical protein OS493_013705 [Desmophyllum pertusum]|uniref:Uncharacterized protein n=1 Tax=Desmophyllum pertusum TaxID=174260 RepID=A0A9X0D3A0_9CNID|nr:hypothetical protein OS493_013705 [Desmophyllum pertusum]
MLKGERAVRQELNELDNQMSDLLNAEQKFRDLPWTPNSIKKDHRRLIKQSEVLKKVAFLSVDVKEWIIENDLLVLRLKEDDSQSTIQEVLDNFTSLLERVQGLPPESSFICYEQAIAYNLSHLILRGHINILVGGLHKSVKILHRSLSRAFEAFKREDCLEGAEAESGDMTDRDLFSAANIEHTLDTLLPLLFKVLHNKNIGCAPLVLSCCLLAFLWLLDEDVDKAVELLQLMQSQLKHFAEVNLSSTEEVPANRRPVCLFSLEYIPSITNCVITSSTKDLTDIQNLLSVVTSLLAFAHYANKDYDKVLEALDDKVQIQDVGYNDLYLKGYILYVRSEVDEALQCFQQCLHISQGQDKAAALNMLGCCCAVKGKHHTAVAKFRNALEHDFQQLEALFNISLQYRKLGNVMAEIQTLKLLKQAIQSKESDQGRCYDVAVIPNDQSSDRNKRKLDVELSVPPRFALASVMSSGGVTSELVTYMLAKRLTEIGRIEEAANSYLELLANIVDMRTASFRNSRNLPSPTELYQQCAFALLKAGRYEDTVTVCDKVLTNVDSVNLAEKGNDDETSANDKAPKKRLRSDDEKEMTNSADEETVSDHIQLLMLKAEALVHIHQPLEALQSLNRLLKEMEGVQPTSYCGTTHQGEQDTEGQQRKRRKVDCGDNVLLKEQNQDFQPNKLVKVKVQAYNHKASILEGLARPTMLCISSMSVWSIYQKILKQFTSTRSCS